MNGNDFMKFMIRSPLRVFTPGMLIVTLTGRKTKKQFSTPVSYVEDGGALWVSSMRNRQWWRNLQDGVMLNLRGKDVRAKGEAIVDEAIVLERFRWYFAKSPGMEKYYDVKVENKKPVESDLMRLAKERLWIKFIVE
jgi:hypothetical protein